MGRFFLLMSKEVQKNLDWSTVNVKLMSSLKTA